MFSVDMSKNVIGKVNFNYILTESPPRLKDGLAIEAYIPSHAKEEAVGVWDFKEEGDS